MYVWKVIEVYLLKLMDLSDKEISIATGNLGVCNMDHILMEDNVIFFLVCTHKNHYFISQNIQNGV